MTQDVLFSRDFIYRLLQECVHSTDVGAAFYAYSLLAKTGLDGVSVLGDHLIRAFTACSCLTEAEQVFCKIKDPTVYSWNSIISAHAKLGKPDTALEKYYGMQLHGVQPDRVTFLSLLKASSRLPVSDHGMVTHNHIILYGFDSEKTIENTCINMYVKCNRLGEARLVFDLMIGNRNEVSWQAILLGYVQHGHLTSALKLLQEMQSEGITPNKVTFLCILKACSNLNQVRALHDEVKSFGFESDATVGSALVDMYSKCGSSQEALEVFDNLTYRNVVTWGAMIASQVKDDHCHAALQNFEKMQQENILPDEAIFSSILKACERIGALSDVMLIHQWIINTGLHRDLILDNTLLDMYCKFGCLEEACKVFNDIVEQDTVTWGTMITGYVENERPVAALQLFEDMEARGIPANITVYLGLIKACGNTGTIQHGRLLHHYIVKNLVQNDLLVDNTLIHMYAKCGNVEEAYRILNLMSKPDIVTWTGMITGYAQVGNFFMVRQCITEMHQRGFHPDIASITSVIAALSHSGLLEEWYKDYHLKLSELGLTSDVEYLNSMIDFFGRAGLLEEANILIQTLPMEPDVVGYRSMISGCENYGNRFLGQKCLNTLVKHNQVDASGLAIMSRAGYSWEYSDWQPHDRRKDYQSTLS